MLYVFSVDIGVMYTFEMELAMESVQTLMYEVATTTGIPVDKQVLLITGGEALDPSDRVCNYSNAGTDTSPIYLFSKSTIESSVPPLPSLTFGSESNLKEQVEISFKLPPTYETLVSRAQLASEFNHYAVEIARNCETLISEQKFQQQGWAAVVANLESIAKGFSTRATTVQQSYKEFLESRSRYLELLNGYDEILKTLSNIPILPCFLSSQYGISLLDWISAQDQKNSLQDMVTQCSTTIKQFEKGVLEGVMNEFFEVQEALDNTSMKEIKGLDDRLTHLQQLLQKVQELVQSQSEMAQGFIQNQNRVQNIGDASVLPDLCASHQKQLMMLMKNHTLLRDYLRRSAKAKEELSVNLHTRLRWIMYIEKKVCDTDTTLIMYHENIRRIKKRLDILEQVSEAPKMYVVAAAEVVHRRKFSSQILKWTKKMHEISAQMQAEENARREEFSVQFGHHFLQTLFTGLDDWPIKFAEKPPKLFDSQLPNITSQDLEVLKALVPKFKEYLEESPINMSIGEDSVEANSLSTLLKLQESQLLSLQSSQKEMSTSKTAMSVDASTQAIWMDGGGVVIEETHDLLKADNKVTSIGLMKSSQTSQDESAPLVVQHSDDSPPKNYHKDSDTGSEPSSGLTDSDIMFKSAQDEYVTVEGTDFDIKDGSFTQNEGTISASITAENDSTQTLTLNSSGSQSITASTQTDLCFEESLSCSVVDEDRNKPESLHSKEDFAKLEDKNKELDEHLKSCKEELKITLQRNVNLEDFKTKVTELLHNEIILLREDLRKSKEMISGYKGATRKEVEFAQSKVQEFTQDILNTVSKLTSERTKETLDLMIEQIGEKYECEKSKLINEKVELELKINHVSIELQKALEEKNSNEVINASALEKLTREIEEYKEKYEEQQNTLVKLKESKVLSEEEKQTRFNAIIGRLKREKDQIIRQLNEKMKEFQIENEKMQRDLNELKEERDCIAKSKELEVVNFQEKEKEYTTSISSLKLELQQMQGAMESMEKEFESALAKEKAKALHLLDMERQMWEAEKNKQEDAEMTEAGGNKTKELGYIQRLEQTQKGLVEEEQTKGSKKPSKSVGVSEPQKPEKVTLKDFQCGDLILLVFDPRYENYLVFTTGSTLYFLHPEAMSALDIATTGVKRRDWVLAQLTDKEYCQAKKAQNRFHVPVGTKFYRIHAKQWER